MNTAIGMVAAMVNVPHGLPLSALTTTSPITASRMIMISRTVISAVNPPTLPTSSRAIWPERFSIAPDGTEQDHEILHGSAQGRSDHDPQEAGKVAELGGQSGSHQRTGTGDRREMVAEDDPLVGGLEIVAVAQPFGGGGARVVESHDAGGDKSRIEAVPHQVGANGGDHQPGAVDRLAAAVRHGPHGEGGRQRNRGPQDTPPNSAHSFLIRIADRRAACTVRPVVLSGVYLNGRGQPIHSSCAQ